MSASGGYRAIVAALGANTGIAIAKFVGAALTGSGSMLAEAVHSVADTGNQGLLLLGRQQAERQADEVHQFGYGRSRFVFSFVVALVLFSVGSLYALYEGIHKLQRPQPLSSPVVAVVILAIAAALESYSFLTARRESATLRGNRSWWRFIRTTRNPELPVVLLEDTGALIGLLIALTAVVLTILTDNPLWDGLGTLGICVLLGTIAAVLVVEMHSLLLGEGATTAEFQAIAAELVDGTRIQRVIHLRTEYLAPDEILVAAKIAIAPELNSTEVAAAIDDAEARVRKVVPLAKDIYLEPDIDRNTSGSSNIL